MVEILKRKISIEMYTIALILTLMFFIIGIFIGNYLAYKKTDTLDVSQRAILAFVEIFNAKQNYTDEQLCNLSWGDIWKEKVEIGAILTSLENRLGKNDARVMEQKRVYNEIQLKTLDIVEAYKEKCDSDWKIILFFYTNNPKDSRGSAELSDRQGYMLNTVYNINQENNKIFAFDGNAGGVEDLMKGYNITRFPSLVIEGVVYNEFKSAGEIWNILSS